jgi:co-chaperonin GroES (HSP10)
VPKRNFKPVNRYLHIQVPEAPPPQTDSGIVLPESFKPTEERYIIACVMGWATDVRFNERLEKNCNVIVDKSMIEQFQVEGKQYNVILDNYIIGIL